MKLLPFLFILIGINCLHAQSANPEKYVCLPCGQDCDLQEHGEPGKCEHCQMDLVKKSAVTFKTIEPSDICDYLSKNPSVILLDVRTKEEFEGTSEPNFGTLKNAINIPIGEVRNRIGELQKFKNREVIVFCSHSHRSPQVSYLLSQNGFKKVSNLNGGMSVMTDRACKK
jgi:rhodanese-related sulfurtransferase